MLTFWCGVYIGKSSSTNKAYKAYSVKLGHIAIDGLFTQNDTLSEDGKVALRALLAGIKNSRELHVICYHKSNQGLSVLAKCKIICEWLQSYDHSIALEILHAQEDKIEIGYKK